MMSWRSLYFCRRPARRGRCCSARRRGCADRESSRSRPADRRPDRCPARRSGATEPTSRRGGRRPLPARIGEIVGRHVDRLHRRDRTFLGRGDPLLQLAHLRRQVRLVADRARHTAEERRDFRPGLREAEDVVDEEEHVLLLGVAEVLGDGQAGQADAQTRAGRLGHLAIDQRCLRLRRIAGHDDAGLGEFEPEVVAFAGPFADAGENREAAVLFGDVVDQLHDQNGLADARAAEQAGLAALGVRLEQVDDLDAGLEHLDVGRLLVEPRRLAMNRPALLRS